MLFHLYVFLVIMLLLFDRLPVKQSLSESIIILSHTVVDIQFPPLQICSYRSPRWPLVGYVVMLFFLQLTRLSSQLSTKISTIKNFQISYTLYIQRKSHTERLLHLVLLHRDTCTERVTHFQLSSGRHMHAWRAYTYFYKYITLPTTQHINV